MTDLPLAAAGFTHYDQVRDPVDHLIDKVLPADFDFVHATRLVGPSRYWKLPTRVWISESAGSTRDAWCGRAIKAVLPTAFDAGDEDACPQCVSALLAGRPATPRWLLAQEAAERDADDS